VSESDRLDAEVLLAHILGRSRSWLRGWGDEHLSNEQQQDYEVLIQRRCEGEPVAYLIGWREFWSMELAVTGDTLIPRPETELLVELALERIPADANWCIADLGTGSGAIALAIASERPGCNVIATDISAAALAVAQKNAARLEIKNIEFRQGNWFEALKDQQFQMIVSNPPYIPEDDPHLQQGDARYEPRHALIAGDDGLRDIRHIAEYARDLLQAEAWLLLEHGYDQGLKVVEILEHYGYANVYDHKDIAGQGRIAVAQQFD
jgi:release factor glutamine methyltransferase